MWEKEKELRQLQEQEETATDLDVKRALHYMIGVAVEALKLNFKRDELPALARLVIMERRKRAVEMKWISRDQAERVTSVWARLPYSFYEPENEYDDDEDIFITPSTQTPRPSQPLPRVQKRIQENAHRRQIRQYRRRVELQTCFHQANSDTRDSFV